MGDDENANPVAQEDSRADGLNRPPLVFISHDTRDAAIAEAFSKLLSNVSAGVLKSFRSSDKSGRQGIDYGVEWFPEIMKNMQDATDVVCLLTDLSIGRPWILFEAGLAKGKLNTPILGIALGIPLSKASAGPFAQFQNSDDDEESLVKLVRQLVSRVPNAEPNDDVIRPHVQKFITSASTVLAGRKKSGAKVEQAPSVSDSDARLFEEVKVMFKEVSSRLRRLESQSTIDTQALPDPGVVYRLTRESSSPEQGLKLALSVIRPQAPWFYDLASEALSSVKRARTPEAAFSAVERFHRQAQESLDAWMYAGTDGRDYELLREYTMMIVDVLHHVAEERRKSLTNASSRLREASPGR